MKLFSVNKLLHSGEKRPQILLHGSQAHLISQDLKITEISLQVLDNYLQAKPRPTLLLAYPFVISLVHETIHLAAKELKQADQQILSFGKSPEDNRSISSIVLNEKTAITIHSHLTRQGTLFLKNLRTRKIRVSWQPAICYQIKNLLYFQQNELNSNTIYRIYLCAEVLQIQRNPNQLKFLHLHYWHQQSVFEKQKQYMETMLEKTVGNKEIQSISFQKQIQDIRNNTSVIKALFFPEKKKTKPKTVEHLIRKRLSRYFRFLTPHRLLMASTLFTLIWAIIMNVQIYQMKEECASQTNAVKNLQQKSVRLTEISKTEREYYKLVSAFETADELKIRPSLLLNKLDSVLPKDIWINDIVISYDVIELVLLDSKETELSDLIESFSNQIGKTNLEKNEVIQINKEPIRKYTFTINNLYPGLLNEKMVKQ